MYTIAIFDILRNLEQKEERRAISVTELLLDMTHPLRINVLGKVHAISLTLYVL